MGYQTKHLDFVLVGGKGRQLSSMVDAMLADKDSSFRPVVMTRTVDDDASNALKARGVEVRYGDADNVDSLKKAFEGAYGIAVVLNFWETFSTAIELQQVKNVAEAA